MARPKKLKGGRPLAVINEDLLKKLTQLHLSDKVISEVLGVHPDTLHSRFSDKMNEWRSVTKGKIAEVLFDEGVYKRKEWALKMLSQKHLGYADKIEHSGEVTNTIKVEKVDLEERIKLLKGEK